MSSLGEKIMASSFWSHIVCFMFMSIWFSTKCFTAFSGASFMSMWFSTWCLKSFSAPKCFKHVFQITCVNPCSIHCQAASPSVHQNCAMEDSHGMCIAFWVTYMQCILFGRSHHQEMMRHGQHSQMTVNYASISLSGST